jgi:DNA-binding NarL/FixJ family response regulator
VGRFLGRAASKGSMKPIRILVADDHEVVRCGLRSILESAPGMEIVGEACDGREAVEKWRELKPDVVIMDICMPLLNGLEATRQITQETPAANVLVLTMMKSEQTVRDILEAGARGYILKSDAGRDLLLAVDSVMNRRVFFTSPVSEMVLSGFLKAASLSPGGAPAGEPLTPREREVVQLLAEGKTSKEAATILGISARTAETHRASIMRKLHLESFSDLVRYAIRNSIIEA